MSFYVGNNDGVYEGGGNRNDPGAYKYRVKEAKEDDGLYGKRIVCTLECKGKSGNFDVKFVNFNHQPSTGDPRKDKRILSSWESFLITLGFHDGTKPILDSLSDLIGKHGRVLLRYRVDKSGESTSFLTVYNRGYGAYYDLEDRSATELLEGKEPENMVKRLKEIEEQPYEQFKLANGGKPKQAPMSETNGDLPF